MTGRFSRRSLLGGLGSALAGAAWADAPTRSLRPVGRAGTVAPEVAGPDYATTINDAGLSGNVGVAIGTVNEPGQPLLGTGGAQLLPPASVAKMLTAVYAIGSLGSEHRFVTRVLARGEIVDGVLEGDLILAGGGDPHLATDDLARIAERLRDEGLREVRGRFLVWEGALPVVRSIDPSQLAHVGYSPAVSGLNLNFNRVHFEWRPNAAGYSVTMDARSDTRRPDVTMATMQIADRDIPVYTYSDGGGVDNWTVAKGALGEGGARWLPVRYPALYAADVFRTVCAAAGIKMPAGRISADQPAGRPLVLYPSPPLSEIVAEMLKYSTNLTAEAIGMAASVANQGVVRDLPDSARAMARWLVRRYGVAARLVDHSGLGDASRLTANGLVRFLSSAEVAQMLRPVLKPIYVLDGQGRSIQTHRAALVAKTGTLDFVAGLAGYIETPTAGLRAFAIFAADLARREVAKAEGEEVSRGARSWNGRARRLQQKFIAQWADQ